MCISKLEGAIKEVGLYVVFLFLSVNHKISTHEACPSPFMCLSGVRLPSP